MKETKLLERLKTASPSECAGLIKKLIKIKRRKYKK